MTETGRERERKRGERGWRPRERGERGDGGQRERETEICLFFVLMGKLTLRHCYTWIKESPPPSFLNKGSPSR